MSTFALLALAAQTTPTMAYGGAMRVRFVGLCAGFSIFVGCGGKSSDDAQTPSSSLTGGANGSAMGGGGSSSIVPSAGGPIAAGGRVGVGGALALIGGAPLVITGGRVSIGGAAAGGVLVTAGNGSQGGASTVATGGKTNTGGAPLTGGKSATGGSVPTGGKVGTGGAIATGGSLSLGGSLATGGTSAVAGAATTGGYTGDAGDPFCQGEQSKVLYQGRQLVLAAATNYESAMIMDCCTVYGVNLHTRDTLGFDVDVENLWNAGGAGTTLGVVSLGSSTSPLRATVHRSTESATTMAVAAEGTAEIFSLAPHTVGLCVSLYKTATTLYNTLIYVPKVRLSEYADRSRFQIFLLSDSSVTPSQAISQGLASVSLAATPLLDLSRIAYVAPAVSEIGFNPGQKIGDALQTRKNELIGHPFVIVADGERISLGAFMSDLMSSAYPVPEIMIESIKTDSLLIQMGGPSGNPLKDARTISALTATGKLIP